MAPSFPSERESDCERLRTGLLTCAFEPPSQSRTPSVQLQWLKGQIRKVRKALAEILFRPHVMKRREAKQVRSQLRGSDGISPSSRTSWRLLW